MIEEETPRPNHLEPRVAKLEAGLEILTKDVATLASITREQGKNLEHEIQKLTVAVTQASGPRKTDWQTILSAIMLIMAIGSAIFWPLNQTAQNNKNENEALAVKFEEHQKLNLHPVGQALLQRVEEQLKTHVTDNARQMKDHIDENVKAFGALNDKFRRELSLSQDMTQHRLSVLENSVAARTAADERELQAWRFKALGLSLTNSAK